jgi:hypothetical protein
MWWYTSIILALRRPRQEDYRFEAILRYIVRPCPKKQKEENKINLAQENFL